MQDTAEVESFKLNPLRSQALHGVQQVRLAQRIKRVQLEPACNKFAHLQFTVDHLFERFIPAEPGQRTRRDERLSDTAFRHIRAYSGRHSTKNHWVIASILAQSMQVLTETGHAIVFGMRAAPGTGWG